MSKTTKTNETNSIAPLVQEAERYLKEAVKAFGLTLDPKKIVVTIQTKGRKNARGWYWGKRWNCGKTELNEINLCAEYLKTDMAELLLHELAHAENNFIGLKDCTASQVHNKKFKAMAEKLGLVVADRDKRYGFAFTSMGTDAIAFTKKVKFNQEIFSISRLGEDKEKKKAGSRLRKYVCGGECGQIIRAATDSLECTCDECEAPYKLADSETDGE